MSSEESSSPGNSTTRLPPDEFKEKLDFLQQYIQIKEKTGTLSEEDAPSAELLDFLTKMNGTPAAILSRFCQVKGIPIFNYFCLEVPDSK